jgi:hypothetical protein
MRSTYTYLTYHTAIARAHSYAATALQVQASPQYQELNLPAFGADWLA